MWFSGFSEHFESVDEKSFVDYFDSPRFKTRCKLFFENFEAFQNIFDLMTMKNFFDKYGKNFKFQILWSWRL